LRIKYYIARFPAVCLFIGLVGNLTAQEKTIIHENQQWLQYYLQLRLSEKWNVQGDAGYRWKESFSARNQYVLRVGGTYRATPALQVGGGMAYSGSYGDEGLEEVEFRPFQDISLKSDFRYFDLSQRFRMEERFYNPVVDGRISSPNDFNLRLRYALTANIPLLHFSEKRPAAQLSLQLGDEIFINAGKAIVTDVFDKNRIVLGPSLQWSKSLTFAFTWSNQFASTAIPDTYRNTQVFWLQIKQQIDLGNKKQAL